MKLKGPNKADKAKLHLEVNQLVNQRFLLTTLAVTIFGVMVAWTLPEPSVNDVKTSGSPIGAYRLSLTALLQVTLFLIFLLGHNLSKMLRILTTYLEVTKKSNWERDWCRYRTSPYMGYTKPQSIVFLALGVFTTSIPLLLPLVFPFVLEPLPGVLAVLALGVIYLVLVGGMGFRGWFSSERAIRSRWVALKKKGDSYRDKAAPPIASDAQPPLEEDKRQERTRLLLELLGTSLLLGAAGWQIFVEGSLRDMQLKDGFYRVESKLDDAWLQIGALQDQVGEAPDRSGTAMTFRDANSRRLWAGDGLESLESQVEFTTIVRGLSYLIGTLLLVCSRYLRYKGVTSGP